MNLEPMNRPSCSSPIAFFVPSLQGGGAERVITLLANQLSRRGLRVDLVLARATGALLTQVADDVNVLDLGASRTLFALPGLISYLRRERPASVLSTLAHASTVASLAIAMSGIRTRHVIREANFFSEQKKRATRPREKTTMRLATWAYRRANKVIAVSREMAEDLQDALGLPAEKIVTIYNPVDLEQLRILSQMAVNHDWLVGDEAVPVILGIGRLEAQKDFATLLRAFAQVRSRRDCRLIILGEGSLRYELRALARELGVAEHVDLPGFVNNPYAYLVRASVFVLSSAHEGMPNALIEALALGVPVVATNCRSGPAEILEGGRWGRLTPVGDVSAMAQAIQEALAQPCSITDEIIESVRERFDLNKIADRYLEVLSDGQ